MRIAYLDCFAGAAGDMFLGALVDAGVPRSVLEEATEAMDIGASLKFESVDRSGITATKVWVVEGGHMADAVDRPAMAAQQEEHVQAQQAGTQHRHGNGPLHSHGNVQAEDAAIPDAPVQVHGRSLSEIRRMIEGSALGDAVKTMALQTFELLGRSEAKIHNVPVDEVHFHEVGAVDAIVDIVASYAGIVHLGIEEWYCSPVNVGGGTVRCAHGVFPVPAPATADLLRGLPTYSAHVQTELVTPTGAALLRALAPSFGPQPAMAVQQIGYGAGTRNPPDFANVLRLSVGESSEEPVASHRPQREGRADARGEVSGRHTDQQSVAVLETALDDATPQLVGFVSELALKMGALDVMLTPVIMKKGRPGTLVTLLADPGDSERFEQMLLRETTTLGVRVRYDRRICLQREHVTVPTPYGSIRVKTGAQAGEVLNANPEFEDCRRAAEEHGVPLKQVHAAAAAAYWNSLKEESQA